MRWILTIFLFVLGASGGVAAGLFLAPATEDMAAEDDGATDEEPEAISAAPPRDEVPDGTRTDTQFVKLNNQFVVPVVRSGRVEALVVASLSIEIEPNQQDAVFQREPRIRDSLLQVLFNHSNLGGFEGNFINSRNMTNLRSALRSEARRLAGDAVVDVLITDIVRQDNE